MIVRMILGIVIVLSIQGCETMKGAKKDVQNTWHNVTSIDGPLQKTDRWLQENAW